MIPFLNFEEDFLTTEDLLFLAGASGVKGVEDTATGNPVTFLTDLAKPLKSLKANFLPIQSGTGDPSPTNIRPITGWTGLDVMHGADQTDYDTYPVTWQTHGTIYGGYVDLVTGEVWAEYAEYTFTGNEGFDRTYNTQGAASDEGYYFRWAYEWQGFLIDNWNVGQQDVKIDAYNVYNNLNYWYSGINKGDKVAWTVGTYKGVAFRDDSYESIDAFKQAIAGKKMVYKYAQPVLITTLTPQQINALKGNNTVWSDANGDCEVTYLKKG